MSGLHDLKRTLEMTAGFKLRTNVIINKFDINTDMTSIIETYCNQNGIQVIGKLPFDPLIVEAMVNCQSITDYAPDSDISSLLKNIYSKIITV